MGKVYGIVTLLLWLGGLWFLWIVTSTPVHFASNLIVSYFLVWGLFFPVLQALTSRENTTIHPLQCLFRPNCGFA